MERPRPLPCHPQQPEPHCRLLPAADAREGLWAPLHDRLVRGDACRSLCHQHRRQEAVRHRGVALCLLLHRDGERRDGGGRADLRGRPPPRRGLQQPADHHQQHVGRDGGDLPDPQLPDHHHAGHRGRDALVCLWVPHAVVPAAGIQRLAREHPGRDVRPVDRHRLVHRRSPRRHRERGFQQQRPDHRRAGQYLLRDCPQRGAASWAAARRR
mmetsp:Transcript_21506/g.51312  ORF Transcript_21506/g.51312 Transcript_21506/m.51312 type:complete len:212 (+) Transcript_21506:854-1489(+)